MSVVAILLGMKAIKRLKPFSGDLQLQRRLRLAIYRTLQVKSVSNSLLYSMVKSKCKHMCHDLDCRHRLVTLFVHVS